MKGDRATALVYKNGKILMIHRFKFAEEYYVLPGGGVEDGESVETAVMRELKEETSLEAKLDEKLYSFKSSADNYPERVHHIYLCKYISGTPKLAPDSPESKPLIGNVYEPMWVEVSKIADIKIWPDGTKEFLLNYFKK